MSDGGKAVTVEYTTNKVDGSDTKGQPRARYCSEKMSAFKTAGRSYTVEFTIDSKAYVGVMLDGNTGFIINPSLNSTSFGKADIMNYENYEGYEGTFASKQTYAIEMTCSATASNGVYPPTVYRLLVKDEASNSWKVIREITDAKSLGRFEFETGGYDYFYLAVTRYGNDKTNTDADGNSVKSTVSNVNIYKGIEFLPRYTGPVVETVKFTAVDVYAQNSSGNKVKWGDGYAGDKALDGILHEENFASARNNKDELAKRAYFNESGEIAFKDDASYYGILVAELNMLADVETFTIWSPNSVGGGWLDNAAYDIYYSVDGVSFAPVAGATYDDAISAHKNVALSEFPGTATSGNSTGKIYRNDVDMMGVTAKYIAIAVKDTIPDKFDKNNPAGQDRMQIVLYELTLDATPAEEKMMSLVNGASVRMDEPTGLRFTGLVNKDYLDGLREEYDNVTVGMLITPKDYLVDNGLEFTKEALDACGDITGKKYLEIDATTILTDGDNYKVNCAIVNVNSNNYGRAFSAILYIKIDGEIVEYSDFNEVFNSRSVSYVAEKAYSDLADKESTEYANEVTVGDVVKYSPYTEEQRKVLADFFQ